MTVAPGAPRTAEGLAVFADTTPIDRYLAEQADLTAVERFAQHHAAELLPRQARYYQDLIPLRQPVPGQQYGFEVDLDACTGCKACVTACRSLNGLDDDESWRSVGLLHGTSAGQPHVQTVTTACHHCVDPACLNGCPADAYDKDAVTGIVRHLDDQCIGCGYCTLTCPYEVPLYNARLGIVRKCDMCRDRLGSGEAPACVQACPNGAIRIALVDTAATTEAAKGAALVPGAPSSEMTVPTTVYRTRRTASELVAADRYSLRPAHAHPPLAVMLVLTQLSVGAFVTELALRLTGGGLGPVNAAVALGLGLLALGASVLHLGRPRYAVRAAIGFRHSWLSREIVAFGAFAGLATLYAAALWVAPSAFRDVVALVLGGLVGVAGLAGVICSIMVYAVTRRVWWRGRVTATKFLLTTAVCGLATVVFTSLASSVDEARPLAVALAAATAAKLAWEATFFRHLRSRDVTDLKRTAMLLSGDLAASTRWRFGLGLAGGVAVPGLLLAVTSTAFGALVAGVGLVAVVAGELVERSQFFRAVASPRMPGSLA